MSMKINTSYQVVLENQSLLINWNSCIASIRKICPVNEVSFDSKERNYFFRVFELGVVIYT